MIVQSLPTPYTKFPLLLTSYNKQYGTFVIANVPVLSIVILKSLYIMQDCLSF